MKTGKVWGESTVLLSTPLIEIHKILIKPNSFCSLHQHQFKNNSFYVIKGTLYIETHKNDYELIDITSLSDGEFSNFIPGEFHKFFTKTSPVEALEIYHLSPINVNDIVRKTVGGVNKFDDN